MDWDREREVRVTCLEVGRRRSTTHGLSGWNVAGVGMDCGCARVSSPTVSTMSWGFSVHVRCTGLPPSSAPARRARRTGMRSSSSSCGGTWRGTAAGVVPTVPTCQASVGAQGRESWLGLKGARPLPPKGSAEALNLCSVPRQGRLLSLPNKGNETKIGYDHLVSCIASTRCWI